MDVYVYDEDSHDGTLSMLKSMFENDEIHFLVEGREKVGWARSINKLAQLAIRSGGYDTVVVMAPGVTEMTPGTIAGISRAAKEATAIVSPIPGINGFNPPIGKSERTSAGLIRLQPCVFPFLYATPADMWARLSLPEDDETPTQILCQMAMDEHYVVGYLEGYRASV